MDAINLGEPEFLLLKQKQIASTTSRFAVCMHAEFGKPPTFCPFKGTKSDADYMHRKRNVQWREQLKIANRRSMAPRYSLGIDYVIGRRHH